MDDHEFTLHTVKIPLLETDINNYIEVFRKTKEELSRTSISPFHKPQNNFTVIVSYAHARKEPTNGRVAYLTARNPCIRTRNAESRDISLHKRDIVDKKMREAVRPSQIFVALRSDDYFHSEEGTEGFPPGFRCYFQSMENPVFSLYWRA